METSCEECKELSDDSEIVKDCSKITADLDRVFVDYVDLSLRFVLGRKGDLASWIGFVLVYAFFDLALGS